MKSAIDSAGRIVIPKPIRDAANLQPGAMLEVIYRDGAVVIEPAPRSVRVVKRGQLRVAVPAEESPALAAQTVRETRDSIRRKRES